MNVFAKPVFCEMPIPFLIVNWHLPVNFLLQNYGCCASSTLQFMLPLALFLDLLSLYWMGLTVPMFKRHCFMSFLFNNVPHDEANTDCFSSIESLNMKSCIHTCEFVLIRLKQHKRTETDAPNQTVNVSMQKLLVGDLLNSAGLSLFINTAPNRNFVRFGRILI
jgi:hypothetical protein